MRRLLVRLAHRLGYHGLCTRRVVPVLAIEVTRVETGGYVARCEQTGLSAHGDDWMSAVRRLLERNEAERPRA